MAISFQQTRTVEAVQTGTDSLIEIEGFVHEGTGYAYLQYNEGAPYAGMIYRRTVGEQDSLRMLVDHGDFIVKINGKIDGVVDAKGLLTQYGHAAS